MSNLSASELEWGRKPCPDRLAILQKFRHRICADREQVLRLLQVIRSHSSRGELISSEFVPLLDASRFLEAKAESILAPRRLGKSGQPVWLWGVESTIYREPLGRIMILAPGNYPLFLPLVQALQAWAAGNSVWLKSAPGSFLLHKKLQELYLACGGQEEQFRLLGEETTAYLKHLSEVQKVVLVGSAQTARVVLRQAGEQLVPAVAELSGWDTVFVHPQADMERAAQAVAFGLSLNQGRTCLAPRRVFLRGDLEVFEHHFHKAIAARACSPLTPAEAALVANRTIGGARYLSSALGMGPGLLSPVGENESLLRQEFFASLAVLRVVGSDHEALTLAKNCSYALGASLFGPIEWCQEMAQRVPAQMISINDTIVATADPRLPFGGSGMSGYGRMRGSEGLLEMTQTRTVSVRQGGSLDHLRASGSLDDLIVEQFFLMSHSHTAFAKAKALWHMIAAIARERIKKRKARTSKG